MKNIFALIGLFTISCVSATASDDITKTQEFTFTGAPVGLPGFDQTIDQSIPVDVHEALQSLKDIGDVNLSILSNSLSGDLAWVHHVKLTVSTKDKPDLLLSDMDVQATTSVNVPFLVGGNELADYLGSGETSFHFWMTGSVPVGDVKMTHTITLHADVSVEKSLSDLKK